MRRVLAHRQFRLLWASQLGSTVGDRLVLVALALYVNRIGSPTDVGLVLAAGIVPFVALVLVGGVWADRLPRQRVMIASDVVRGLLHALLAVLILNGSATVAEIVGIEVAFGAARAFFQPAYSGLVPQTVPAEELQAANAVTQASDNAASFVGPALASLLVVTAGAGWAFVVDAGTFFASALLLTRLTPRPRGTPVARRPLIADLAHGWGEVRARRWVLLVITSATFSLMVGYAPFSALGPEIAGDVYGHTAIFGVISAISGAGAILGSALAVRWRPGRPIMAAMLATLPFTISYLAFAAGLPLWGLAPFAVASGAGLALFMVWWDTTLAMHVPATSLSRVAAFDWMGSLGLGPVGLILAGPIAATIGARTTLAIGAGLALAFDLCVTASSAVRNVRQPNSGTPVSEVEASA
jgi:hypothetical protein